MNHKVVVIAGILALFIIPAQGLMSIATGAPGASLLSGLNPWTPASLKLSALPRTEAQSSPASSGGNVTATVTLGTLPTSEMFDSGNGYVYVGNAGTSNISVVSGTQALGSIPLGITGNSAMAYDNGNGFLYVTTIHNYSSLDNVSAIFAGVTIANYLALVTTGGASEGARVVLDPVADKSITTTLTQALKIGLKTIAIGLMIGLLAAIVNDDSSTVVSTLEGLGVDVKVATFIASILVILASIKVFQEIKGAPQIAFLQFSLATELFVAMLLTLNLAVGSAVPVANVFIAFAALALSILSATFIVSFPAQVERLTEQTFPVGTMTQVGAGLEVGGSVLELGELTLS